jgi:hypothetical protein
MRPKAVTRKKDRLDLCKMAAEPTFAGIRSRFTAFPQSLETGGATLVSEKV